MRVLVKDKVGFSEFNDELFAIIKAADTVWKPLGVVPTITSANDGKHMKASKHYTNQALDLRTINIPPSIWKAVARELQNELGPDFDVVVETGSAPHIHCEYDPK